MAHSVSFSYFFDSIEKKPSLGKHTPQSNHSQILPKEKTLKYIELLLLEMNLLTMYLSLTYTMSEFKDVLLLLPGIWEIILII